MMLSNCFDNVLEYKNSIINCKKTHNNLLPHTTCSPIKTKPQIYLSVRRRHRTCTFMLYAYTNTT